MYSRDNRTKVKFNLCLVSTGCCSLSSRVTLAITLPNFQYCSFFIREMITLRIKQILFWSWPVPTGIFPNFFPIFVCSIGIILDTMHPSLKQKKKKMSGILMWNGLTISCIMLQKWLNVLWKSRGVYTTTF